MGYLTHRLGTKHAVSVGVTRDWEEAVLSHHTFVPPPPKAEGKEGHPVTEPSTRLVFWYSPIENVGMVADRPDGTRVPRLTETEVVRIAREWARDRVAAAKREAPG